MPLGDNPICTQSICVVAVSSTPPISIVASIKSCCYNSPVLAHLTENEDYKNDINGFMFKRNFSSETIDLYLEKNGGASAGGIDIPLNDDSYGKYYNFGGFTAYPNYKAYKIEWKKVLQLQGEGSYRLRVEQSLITGSLTTYSISFALKSYNQDRANGTFRIQSIQNGYLKPIDIDFTGLNWKDGLRVEGFFGNRNIEYTDERIIYQNDQARQVRSEKTDKYICQTMFVPHCITSRIVDYHNFGNILYLTDYNSNNHRKDYVNHKVIIDSLDSFEYNNRTDYAKLEITYKDYIQNGRKINC